MVKLLKTSQALGRDYTFDRNYAIMSEQTGIEKSRLRNIRKGEKPTRSEINRISNYDRREHAISPEILSKFVGFKTGEIKKKLSYSDFYFRRDKKGNKVKVKFKGKELAERRSLNFRGLFRNRDGTVTTVRPGFAPLNRHEEKYIYYVRLFENYRDHTIVVSQGFIPYSSWNSYKPQSGETKYRWHKETYSSSGDLYTSDDWFFDVLQVPGLAELVQSRR